MDFNITQRLLCAAAHTYSIAGNTNNLGHNTTPGLPNSSCVGYRGPIAARQSIGSGIDAALVGVIDEGIIVAVRGTLSPDDLTRPALEIFNDWKNNSGITLKAAKFGDQAFPGTVHELFAKSFGRLWEAVRTLVAARMAPGVPKRIYITGHSKGGALCVLFAWALAHTFDDHAVIVRTFAAPRVADLVFAAAYEAQIRNHIRFEYDKDIVPHLPLQIALLSDLGLPPLLVAAVMTYDPGYGQVGTLCFIDTHGHCSDAATATQVIRYQQLIAYLMTHPFDVSFVKTCHPLMPGYGSGHFGPPPPPGGMPYGMPEDLPPEP